MARPSPCIGCGLDVDESGQLELNLDYPFECPSSRIGAPTGSVGLRTDPSLTVLAEGSRLGLIPVQRRVNSNLTSVAGAAVEEGFNGLSMTFGNWKVSGGTVGTDPAIGGGNASPLVSDISVGTGSVTYTNATSRDQRINWGARLGNAEVACRTGNTLMIHAFGQLSINAAPIQYQSEFVGQDLQHYLPILVFPGTGDLSNRQNIITQHFPSGQFAPAGGLDFPTDGNGFTLSPGDVAVATVQVFFAVWHNVNDNNMAGQYWKVRNGADVWIDVLGWG